jgi:hypothetical protein
MTDRAADDLLEGLAVLLGCGSHGEALAAVRTYVGVLRVLADELAAAAWLPLEGGGVACVHCLREHSDPAAVVHDAACPVRRRVDMRGRPFSGGDGRPELGL